MVIICSCSVSEIETSLVVLSVAGLVMVLVVVVAVPAPVPAEAVVVGLVLVVEAVPPPLCLSVMFFCLSGFFFIRFVSHWLCATRRIWLLDKHVLGRSGPAWYHWRLGRVWG